MSDFNISVINIINIIYKIICIVTNFFLGKFTKLFETFICLTTFEIRGMIPLAKEHIWPASPLFWCNGWKGVLLGSEHMFPSRNNIFLNDPSLGSYENINFNVSLRLCGSSIFILL